MIEKMIDQVKLYLPLKILEVGWDGAVFNMYGSLWNFTTFSAWRITTKDRMIFGCNDTDSKQLISALKGVEILDIDFQNNFLKIDPVFILSSNQRLEIFSTDIYEPWTFQIKKVAFYAATPSEPQAFDPD